MIEVALYTVCIAANMAIVCMAVWLGKQAVHGMKRVAKIVIEEDKEINRILETEKE